MVLISLTHVCAYDDSEHGGLDRLMYSACEDLVMFFALLFACGSTPSEVPDAPVFTITADQVLQRHVEVSKQCDLLVADNYALEWEAVITDKATSAQQERILQQGRQGTSFTRVHQRTRPEVRFTAFGLAADKTWWSAGDLGVRKDLPESIAKTLMVHLDPTPICSYQARWKERTYVAEESFGTSERVHHIQGTWSDDSVIDLYFGVEDGLLRKTETRLGELTNTLEYTKYDDYDGIKWPGETISSRVEGPLHVFIAEKLLRLQVNNKDFRDIGYNEIAILLAQQAKKREVTAADKEK